MNKTEVYEAGLKLLGIYFIANAVFSCGVFIYQMVQQMTVFSTAGLPAGFFNALLFGLLHPGIQLAVGIVLIKKARWITTKLEQQ